MYNEKLKKITSLTLMTIMLAGGMTMASPGVIPDANAELVQRENLSVSSDRFGGPMILEIIVDDADIDDTGESQGAPDVEFNSNNLIMTQGDDGAWYAYVAHYRNVDGFDSTGLTSIDFGTPNDNNNCPRALSGTHTIFCNADVVIRNPANILASNPNSDGINDDNWPFIQTFDDLSDDATLDVVYRKAGSPQTIQVEYDVDIDDFSSYET